MAELVLRGVENDEELRLASDMMARTHCTDYLAGVHWLETTGAGYPGFRREHVRIGMWKGELAGALRLNLETIRIGEARLRMGGFGWITTSARFNGKGLTRALVEHALRYLASQGCHVALLFGAPHFYRRFGFVQALEECTLTVAARELTVPNSALFKVRNGKPGDIRAIQRIHEASDGAVSCSVVRSAGHISNRWAQWRGVKVLTDRQGRVFGYFVHRTARDEMMVEEAAADTIDGYGALLAACAQVALAGARPHIHFCVPPVHPLASYLRPRACPCEWEAADGRTGMMALLSVEDAFESMIPEWENGIGLHEARDWRVETTLVVDHVPYRLRAVHGAVDVARVSGQNKLALNASDLVQMLTGFRPAGDFLDRERRLLTAQARELISLLFPKRAPYVWPLDRF